MTITLRTLIFPGLVMLLAATELHADTIYVSGSQNSSDAIEEFTQTGVSSVFTFSNLSSPQGIIFDSAGNLCVANETNNTIEKFTFSAVGSVFATSGLSDPVGLAFDHSGNLYATNFLGNSVITKITPAGVSSTFATSSSGLNVPYGLAVDGAGNLYAANYMGNTITKFTNGVGSVFAHTGLSNPTGMAFDSAGNLYVANSGSDTLEKFTATGVGTVFATGLHNPTGLAFDSTGNLYVANNSSESSAENGFPDSIVKITSAGVVSIFSTETQAPHFIAISPINIDLTKIISLTGNLAFGPVVVNDGGILHFTIHNTGNTAMTITSTTYPSGFSGNYFGTISAGGSQDVTVLFSPTALISYGGNVTVNSDASSGTNTIPISGQGGSLPVFTSATTATFTAGRAGSFKLSASGVPAPTFSALIGLPDWATLDATTGVITGTPPDTSGAPFSPLFIATNGVGSANQSVTINVLPAPVPVTFGDWQMNKGLSGPNGGMASIPWNDGVPNLLKYLYDINPTASMSAADRSALPAVGTLISGGVKYLTLTYRENPTVTDIGISVEISSDLKTWARSGSDPVQTDTDQATGDPIMQAQVPLTEGTQFIRLNVTGS